MGSYFKRRKLIVLFVVLAAAVLLWKPVEHIIFSVRIALSLQKLAAGTNGQILELKAATVHRKSGDRDYEALIYYPARKKAAVAIILMPGLSELGCRHPRLVALSRVLADKGIMVVTPDIREFRRFQISAEPIDQLLFWYKEVSRLPGGENVVKTGLAGISFSGTLALMTAARPEIRESVGFVVAIGPYYDLIKCTRGWFAANPDQAGKQYPTRFYAKWIIVLSALDMIAEERERLFLHEVLVNLLRTQKVPPADGLSTEGERWYALATMHGDQSDEELSLQIEKHLIGSIYPKLDPRQTLDKIICPVFLIHGAYDKLIPPEESGDLHRRISTSHLLVSPFITHTHPVDAPMEFRQKTKAIFKTLVFCYQLSQVISD
jgi:pimeloyl-ACP methyl ester carboxylesterase